MGFLLGVSVTLNIFLLAGYKVTVDNMRKEVEKFKKDNKQDINESYASKTASSIIKAAGGIDNILNSKVCVTRLRLELKDLSKIDESYFTLSGYPIFVNNNSLQIIMGNSSVKTDICYLINNIKGE